MREMLGNCQGISHCLESGHPVVSVVRLSAPHVVMMSRLCTENEVKLLIVCKVWSIDCTCICEIYRVFVELSPWQQQETCFTTSRSYLSLQLLQSTVAYAMAASDVSGCLCACTVDWVPEWSEWVSSHRRSGVCPRGNTALWAATSGDHQQTARHVSFHQVCQVCETFLANTVA